MISDADLRKTLVGLPGARLRRTCELVWLRGLSTVQASAALGVNVRALEKRLERARRRLRAAGLEPPDARRRRRRTRRRAARHLGLNQAI
jgi:DNA-directed RNA polymerase specialized sigma24 family protein